MSKIRFFYPNFLRDAAVARVLLRMSRAIQQAGADISVMGNSSSREIKRDYPYITDAVPPLLHPFVRRVVTNRALMQRYSSYIYRNTVKKGEIAYIWPGTTLPTYRALQQKGVPTIAEFINTRQHSALQILQSEYDALSLPFIGNISQESIEYEDAVIREADYFFCPSRAVADSIGAAGAEQSQLLLSSYGIEEVDRVEPTFKREESRVKFLFVGYICVRKGVHRLLEAWRNAKVDATLTLVGNIEPVLQPLVQRYLDDRALNIQHIPYTQDLASLYCDSDVFLFPSLEEGSPLVTYLAMGHGLAIIASPMGGGGVIKDGENGAQVDPYSEASLIEKIQLLNGDISLRERLGYQAWQDSEKLLWKNIGISRLEILNGLSG